MIGLNELRRLLEAKPAGEMKDGAEVLRLLAACWDDLPGGSDEAMAARKVARAEDLKWDPPVLSFVIERHGGYMLGSTRAELQRWEIDLEAGTAECHAGHGYRQFSPRDAPFRATPAVRELARKMQAGEDDPGLAWNEGRDHVLLLSDKIVPESEYKQTREGRWKSFFKAAEELLPPPGWVHAGGDHLWHYRRRHSAEPALELLPVLLNLTPGVRLGQLIAAAVPPEDLEGIEDSEFAARLGRLLEAGVAAPRMGPAGHGKGTDADAMAELRGLMGRLPTYPAGDDAERVLKLLAACWDGLWGGEDEGMTSRKVAWAEDLRLEPPLLHFTIRRRGGPTDPVLQYWCVDAEDGIATCRAWYESSRPAAPVPPFRARAVAEELVMKIVAGEDDRGLAWNKERDRVRIVESRIVPTGGSDEARDRRSRNLRKALEGLLPPPGWCGGQKYWQYRRMHPAEPALGLLLGLLTRTPGMRLGKVIAEAVPPGNLATIEDPEFAARLEQLPVAAAKPALP